MPEGNTKGPGHRVVGTIFKKELVETLRDRRTLALMFLLPLVVYPFLVILGSETASMNQSRLEAKPTVVMVDGDLTMATERALESAEHILLVRSSTAGASHRTPKELLSDAEIDAVLTASTTTVLGRSDLQTLHLGLHLDRTRDRSDLAEARLTKALEPLEHQLRKARLDALGLAEQSLAPLRFTVNSVSSRAEMGTKVLAQILPLLVLFFVALSLFYPAVDLTAGEKERGTLATLLVTPVRPLDVVLGKYLAVLCIGSIAAALNVVVIGSTLLRVLASAQDPLGLDLPQVSLAALAGLLYGGFLLAASVSSVMLLVASLARSFRDANTLMTPVLLLLLVPPTLLSSLPGAATPGSLAAVPVLGAVTLLTEALEGTLGVSALIVATLSHALFSAVCIALTTRLFADERALFSEDGARANWKSLLFEPPPLGPGAALAFVAWLFAGNYFVGVFIRPGSALLGVAVVQITVQLIPALLVARWLSSGRARDPARARPSFASVLRLAPPTEAAVTRGRGLTAGALVGIGAGLGLALPLTWLQSTWLAVPPEVSGLAQQLDLGQSAWPALFFALALLPAVAEELAFRGVVLSSLQARLSPLSAVLLHAVFFGLLHASLVRMLPTTALGLVLGLLAVRTRWIVPGLLAHATHNTLIVGLARFAPETARALEEPTPWALLGAGPLLLAAVLLWPRPGGIARSGST